MLVSSSNLFLLAVLDTAFGLSLDVTNAKSLTSAASKIAAGMMSYYTGSNPGDNPGNLPSPYYWWEAGGMFGHMIDYWYYTGDTQYNWKTEQAIAWQAGADGSFMPANQTKSEGNDDQIFWALTAMTAAEYNFNPPNSSYGVPSYLGMAQAVLNVQNGRWDNKTCGGGLRWQIVPLKTGYDYKNSVANGGFFQLAARLARFTGNDSYVTIADRSWDWFQHSPLYETNNGTIFDGGSTETNCTSPDPNPWTYNYGMWMNGLAFLYNHTQNEKYLTPLKLILKQTAGTFFSENNVISEVTCEPLNNCNNDNLIFKSFTVRWMSTIAMLVPQLANEIWPLLSTSATAAAKQCIDNNNGQWTCGYHWRSSTYDGSKGVGQQASALAVIETLLIPMNNLKPPYTAATGGTSKSQPGAGNMDAIDGASNPYAVHMGNITTAGRVGAGILTAGCVIFTVGGTFWLIKING